MINPHLDPALRRRVDLLQEQPKTGNIQNPQEEEEKDVNIEGLLEDLVQIDPQDPSVIKNMLTEARVNQLGGLDAIIAALNGEKPLDINTGGKSHHIVLRHQPTTSIISDNEAPGDTDSTNSTPSISARGSGSITDEPLLQMGSFSLLDLSGLDKNAIDKYFTKHKDGSFDFKKDAIEADFPGKNITTVKQLKEAIAESLQADETASAGGAGGTSTAGTDSTVNEAAVVEDTTKSAPLPPPAPDVIADTTESAPVPPPAPDVIADTTESAPNIPPEPVNNYSPDAVPNSIDTINERLVDFDGQRYNDFQTIDNFLKENPGTKVINAYFENEALTVKVTLDNSFVATVTLANNETNINWASTNGFDIVIPTQDPEPAIPADNNTSAPPIVADETASAPVSNVDYAADSQAIREYFVKSGIAPSYQPDTYLRLISFALYDSDVNDENCAKINQLFEPIKNIINQLIKSPSDTEASHVIENTISRYYDTHPNGNGNAEDLQYEIVKALAGFATIKGVDLDLGSYQLKSEDAKVNEKAKNLKNLFGTIGMVSYGIQKLLGIIYPPAHNKDNPRMNVDNFAKLYDALESNGIVKQLEHLYYEVEKHFGSITSDVAKSRVLFAVLKGLVDEYESTIKGGQGNVQDFIDLLKNRIEEYKTEMDID